MVVPFIHSGCFPKALDNITHLLCYRISWVLWSGLLIINLTRLNTVKWGGIVSITHTAKLKSEKFNNEDKFGICCLQVQLEVLNFLMSEESIHTAVFGTLMS